MRPPISKTLESDLARFANTPKPRQVDWFWKLGDLLLPKYRSSYGKGISAWINSKFQSQLSKGDLQRAVRLRRFYRPEKLKVAMELGLCRALARVRNPKPAYTILDPITFETIRVHPKAK